MFHVPPFHGPKYVISCPTIPWVFHVISWYFWCRRIFVMQQHLHWPWTMTWLLAAGHRLRLYRTPKLKWQGLKRLLVLLPTLDFWALFYFYRCSCIELSRFDNFKDFLGYGTLYIYTYRYYILYIIYYILYIYTYCTFQTKTPCGQRN